MRILTWALTIIVLGYGAHLLMVYALQGQILYQASQRLVTTPADWGLDYQDVTLVSDDGVRIHGWYLPHPGARGTVLFLHGNAGNISHRQFTLERFHELGLNTLIIDYRGYGESEGSPDEAGTYRDGEAAWRYLVEERGLEPEGIIIAGRSLGAAIAARLGAKHTPGAVILESAFTSVPELAADLYPYLPARQLARFEYPTLEDVSRLSSPLLLIHARDDRIVPFDHSERLREAASGPVQRIALEGGHNDGPMRSPTVYRDAWDDWIAQYIESP